MTDHHIRRLDHLVEELQLVAKEHRAQARHGISVVWDYDPGRAPDPFVDAAERAALDIHQRDE